MNALIFAALFFLQGVNSPGNGTVIGRLLSADGSPAAGVRVAAMPVPDPSDPSVDALPFSAFPRRIRMDAIGSKIFLRVCTTSRQDRSVTPHITLECRAR
jgi:hypothetical protein